MSRIIKPNASFTPRELFARMQGAWLEPRLGSMWQENTGATATTSGGQTIGLLLGLDQQQQLGPELVTNGDFSNGTTGWNATNSTLSVVSGELVCDITGSGGGFSQNTIPVVAGRLYKIAFTYRNGTYTSTLQVIVSQTAGWNVITLNTTGSTSFVGYALAIGTGNAQFSVVRQTANTGTVIFDNISVREVLGNHASQATAANRPTYQLNGALPLIRHADSTDVLVAAMPDLGGGVFSSAGSVYFATPQGMSCLHNQSIGTTYNLPALQTDIYGTVITPARLAPPLEQRLAMYMHRLAGLSDADFFWQEQATDGMTGQLLADDNGTILLRA